MEKWLEDSGNAVVEDYVKNDNQRNAHGNSWIFLFVINYKERSFIYKEIILCIYHKNKLFRFRINH